MAKCKRRPNDEALIEELKLLQVELAAQVAECDKELPKDISPRQWGFISGEREIAAAALLRVTSALDAFERTLKL